MSDVQSRSGTNKKPETPAPVSSPPKTTKPKRFLNALGRGAATAKRTGESVGQSIGDKFEKASNFVNYVLSESDYNRRRKRFDGLVAEHEGDERLAAAIADAREWERDIDARVRDPKSDWTLRATACTLATEDLLAGIKTARKQENEARAAYPAIRDRLDVVAEALDAAKLRLTAAEREGFAKELNAMQLELTALPPKPAKNAPEPPLQGKADALGDRIAHAINANAERQNRLRLQLGGLQTRLAAAPGSLPEGSGGGDPRLVVSQLLSEADNALFIFDFQAAETAMRSATTALDQMNAPQPGDLPNPQELLDRIVETRNRTARLVTAAEKLPNPASTEITARILDVVQRLESMTYAVTKGGSATVADVNRVVEACAGELDVAQQTITGYAEFEKSRTGADTAFTKMRQRVQGQAQNYYQKLGITGDGDAAFQTRLAGIQQRWTAAMGTAISMDELNLDAYLNELESLSAEMLGTKGDPAQIGVDKAISRFNTAIAALKQEAERLVSIDSDKAIKLGLTTRPATWQRAGDALLSGKGAALPPADRVQQLDAITLQITELTRQAAAFDASTLAFETSQLRERCETLVREHRRRIGNVLDAVEVERKKTVSIGTSKAERDGLTVYGKSLLDEVTTLIAPLDGLQGTRPLDAGLLGDAMHDLTGMTRRITDFEALGPGGKTDKTIPSFESLGKRIAALTKTLTTSSLFLARAELTEPWTTALDAMAGALTSRDPRETDVALRELEAKVKDAKVAAKKESKEAAEMAVHLRNLSADVTLGRAGLGALSATPSYRKDLDWRLRKMADDVEAADKVLPDAPKLMEEVRKAALAGDAGTLARGQGEVSAQKGQQAYDAARDALQQAKDVDLELLEEKAGRLKGEARKELLKQIKDLRTQTDASLQALELNRDPDAAKAMAQAITERAARLADAPLGSSTRARNNLPVVEKRWIAAVETLHRALDAVPGVVKPGCAGEPAAETAADALPAKLVAPVRAVFRADAFAAVIKRLEVADDETALLAREEALREVRRLRAMMGSDNRIHLLSDVPFEGAVTPFPEIGNALWDMETNLMTSG